MKNKILLPLLALAAGLAINATAADPDHAKPVPKPPAPSDLSAVASAKGEAPAKEGRLDKPTEKDAAWLAKARAAYPLKTCVTSNEDLGSMGEAIDLIYRQDGSPDRLVRFCCDSCIDDFKKEPAKYLKLIDAAGKPANAATTYVCPMHSDITSTKAGDKCSKCGMALVPAKPTAAKPHH